MPWTGTNRQGGKMQRCALCGALVHMSRTVKHDRDHHKGTTTDTQEGKHHDTDHTR